jgi:hypothetical protein
MNSDLKKIGIWSTLLSVIFALAYSIAEILSTGKLISYPQNLFWLFLPSLFLAPAFLVAMISLHFCAEKSFRLWTTIAVAFAILYCADVTIVYFTQLTVVLPAQQPSRINDVFLFDRRTFLMAIDCLGYFFMSFSSFFAAFAFKKYRWLFRGLLWNGALMPILLLAYFYPVFYYMGALWMITFPLAMINAAKFFSTDAKSKFTIKMEYEEQ